MLGDFIESSEILTFPATWWNTGSGSWSSQKAVSWGLGAGCCPVCSRWRQWALVLAGPHICVLVCLLLGFPGGSAGKEFACSVGDLGLIPGFVWSPGEGNNYKLQYSGLENSMDCIYKESDMTERLSLSLFIRCIGPSVNPHSQSIYHVSGNLQNVLHLLL